MTEEDTEFKELVKNRLEQTGLLLGIKAQLRGIIYNILENGDTAQLSQLSHRFKDSLECTPDVDEENKSLKKDLSQELLKNDDCALALFVIEDFLDSMNLTFTKSVLRSEIGGMSKKYQNKTKETVLNELNLLQSGTYDCTGEDNESSLNSSNSTNNKKLNKNQPILLQLLSNKLSPNNSDIVFDQKLNNLTYVNDKDNSNNQQ